MMNISCKGVVFSGIKAIVFDKDGTLENSGEFLRNLGQKRARVVDAQIPGVGEPLLMAFGINGEKMEPTGLMAIGSRLENEIVTAGYIAETGRGWHEALSIARRAFGEADKMLENAPPSPLFPGCVEVLKCLSEAGFKLGILSSARMSSIEAFVTRYQLNSYFQLKMGVDGELGLFKPDPQLFIHSCEALGVTPQETLMVGDSVGDMLMAKDANAAGFIGINWDNQHQIKFDRADVVISRLDQIQISI